MNRTCAACGAGFNARRDDARFCSDRCRKRAARGTTKAQPAVTLVAPEPDASPRAGVEAALADALPARVLDSPRGRIALKLSRDIDASVAGTPGYSGLVRELRTLLDDLDAPAEAKPVNPLTLIRERHAGQRTAG